MKWGIGQTRSRQDNKHKIDKILCFRSTAYPHDNWWAVEKTTVNITGWKELEEVGKSFYLGSMIINDEVPVEMKSRIDISYGKWCLQLKKELKWEEC